MASLLRRKQIYYIQYCVSGRVRRVSTHSSSQQLAKEKLRQFESAQLRGIDNPLPTRTPLPEILAAYVQYLRTTKRPKSAQTDIYYLRHMFGPVCPELEITSRVVTEACLKRKPRPGVDRRRRELLIEAPCFEQITTAQLSAFLTARAQTRGLAPKTLNRYREILVRLFNWAAKQRGVRTPGGINPAQRVERYREHAPQIRFLTLPQIDEQLAALAVNPQIQTMVAVLIYAGLRREEMLWLQIHDLDLAAGAHGIIRIQAKTVDGQFWEPKTKLNRLVPISRVLRECLDRYRPRASRSAWLFPSPGSGSWWDPDNFSADLRALNEKAKLPWSCGDYRHTFGSQLAMKGDSLYKIAKLMGNSPEICRKHYAALATESLIDSVEFPAPPTAPAELRVAS